MSFKELLNMLDSEQFVSEYEKQEKKRRILFFEALGIEDDGRLNPTMTRDEFLAFDKPCIDSRKANLRGKTLVEIYFTFAEYYDYGYDYCFEDDTVYERCLYVGD